MNWNLIPFLVILCSGIFLTVCIVGRNITLLINPFIEKGHEMYADIGRKKK